MAIIAPWVSNGDACTYVMQHPGPNCFMRIVGVPPKLRMSVLTNADYR